MRIPLLLLTLITCLTGCYQVSSNGDDDLRTVPVTNNPNLTPHRDMSSAMAMPY